MKVVSRRFYMLRWISSILGCVILIYGCIKSIDQPITQSEIAAVGVGFEIFYNLEAKEKFAIVRPPLPGIISYSILSSLYQFKNVSAIPSGNYFDLVSFMFALETPRIIGDEILLAVGEENFKVIRYINLLWVALILLVISKGNMLLIGVLSILLYPLTNIIMISTGQVLSAFLVIILLELMSSIISCVSYLKFTLLGVIIGLLISVAGTDGMLLAGIVIVSQVIWKDIEKKKLSKGFKKDWFIGILIGLLVGFFIAWICYGMDLACFCQLQSLLGFEATNSARIVPFFDSLKQIVFEVLFRLYDNQYSILGNLQAFFNLYNVIITTFNLLMIVRVRNLYGIFSIVMILSVVIYNDANYNKINTFFNIITIILTSLTGLHKFRKLFN